MEAILNNAHAYIIMIAPFVASLAAGVGLFIKIVRTFSDMRSDLSNRDAKREEKDAETKRQMESYMRINYEQSVRIDKLVKELEEERNERRARESISNSSKRRIPRQ